MQQTVFTKTGEEKIIHTLKLNTLEVRVEKTSDLTYEHVFQKSLSNIGSLSELLPLTTNQSGLASGTYRLEGDLIIFTFHLKNNSVPIETIKNAKLHEKLKVLKNIGQLQDLLKKGYTLILHPKNLYIDTNGVPYCVYRGFIDTMEPLLQTSDELTNQYKALVFSFFDQKYDFESLYNGALDFAKKTAFLEKIYTAKTVEEIANIIEQSYAEELRSYDRKHRVIRKSQHRLLMNFTIIAFISSLIMIVPLSYLFFVKAPFDNTLLKADKEYIAKQYGDVTTTLKNEKPESLPYPQKYALGESSIRLITTINEASKKSALENIPYGVEDRILEYWIYLYRGDYNKSLNIAKSLNDNNMALAASQSAIEYIKNDKTLDGEQKQELLRKHEEEFEKYYELVFKTKVDGSPLEK